MGFRSSGIGGASFARSIDNYFTQTATIQRAVETNVQGDVTRVWSDLAGHVNLPCAVAGGDVDQRMKKQEARSSELVSQLVYKRVMLAGPYPDISLKDRIVLAVGTYAIVSVVIDQTGTLTQMFCEKLDPSDL